MESVVATVSGYHGSERFQLIKMIAHSGASYVGTMNRCTTHLVCWKYEGKKYEMAKEFGMFIVNHRWVEDCVKQGRRVPEQPYLLQSGHEVGPLVLDMPVVHETVGTPASYQRDSFEASERRELDMEPELDSRSTWNHSWLLNKSMISECGPSNNKFHNINKKEGGRSSPTCSTSKRHKSHVLHEMENEEPFSPSTLLASEQGRSSTLNETQRRRRRLSKQNRIGLDSKTVSREIHAADQLDGRRSSPTCSTSKRYKRHGLHDMENEELFSPSMLLASEQGRSSTENEPQGRRRRLTKKNIIDLDSETVRRPINAADQLDALTTRSNYRNKRTSGKRLRQRVISDYNLVGIQEDGNGSSEEMTDLHTSKDSSIQVASKSAESTSMDFHSNINEIPKGNVPRLVESIDVSCVICWTNFSSTRGVLPCGHRFCFSCIQNWAEVMVSRRKASTCPLCKASFSSITKMDDASSSDQKIFSQTLPSNSSLKDIFILRGDEMHTFGPQPDPNPVCTVCSLLEPADLLVQCHLCQVRCVHSYCLDPPLLPWTCTHCTDLQMMYRHLY